ncbi:hypothetical protein DQ04_13791000 [Trypanosoma grayi]|uniref:hypothetical protein n=1 Tax=Trypanosoma grayi TaxID=71804 RepID=UPI0004F4B2B9|nr:hypothetical protein DQ04_13791000 [Trypanosoma grayi]KEG06464.1 hypothetical protein DQ04_13791000 [Trypanosoma grayi]
MHPYGSPPDKVAIVREQFSQEGSVVSRTGGRRRSSSPPLPSYATTYGLELTPTSRLRIPFALTTRIVTPFVDAEQHAADSEVSSLVTAFSPSRLGEKSRPVSDMEPRHATAAAVFPATAAAAVKTTVPR